MKKFVVLAALAAFPVTAHAADLPSTKSVKAMAPMAPSYWQSGVYVGLTAGASMGSSTQEFPDFYWEGDDSYGSVKGSETTAIGGLEFGVNYVSGNVLIGAEADVSMLNFNTMHPDFPYADAAVGQKVDMLSTARLRAGFIMDQTLVFLTGGLAITKGDVTMNDDVTDTSADNLNTKDNLLAAGWVVGGGVEHALTSNISVKLEALHAETSGKATTTYLGEDEAYSSINKFSTNVVRVGLNYKF